MQNGLMYVNEFIIEDYNTNLHLKEEKYPSSNIHISDAS